MFDFNSELTFVYQPPAFKDHFTLYFDWSLKTGMTVVVIASDTRERDPLPDIFKVKIITVTAITINSKWNWDIGRPNMLICFKFLL